MLANMKALFESCMVLDATRIDYINDLTVNDYKEAIVST